MALVFRRRKACIITTIDLGVPVIPAAPSDPFASIDGSLNAPTGISPTGLGISFPTLLAGYVAPPAWKVPGIHYRPGIRPGVTLKDAKLIPGVGISGNVLTLNTANQVVDGYDFSLNGGYQTDVAASGVQIVDSKFAIGANNFYMLKMRPGADNPSITYCEFYDNFNSEAGSSPNNNGAVIFCEGANLLVEYCWMERAFADFIDAYGGGTLTVQFNVIHDSAAGGHPDWIALGGGTYTTINVGFNLFYNESVAIWGGVGSLGVGLDGFGTYTLNGPFSVFNNVLISLAGAQMNYLISYPPSAPNQGVGFSFSVLSNFMDIAGLNSGKTWNNGGADTAPMTVSGNINMVTGGSIS